MNFDDVIINRCSARCFTNENISEKQIEQILYSASLAPSAKNRQPWKFYILNDKQKNDITKMLIFCAIPTKQLQFTRQPVNKTTALNTLSGQIREEPVPFR